MTTQTLYEQADNSGYPRTVVRVVRAEFDPGGPWRVGLQVSAFADGPEGVAEIDFVVHWLTGQDRVALATALLGDGYRVVTYEPAQPVRVFAPTAVVAQALADARAVWLEGLRDSALTPTAATVDVWRKSVLAAVDSVIASQRDTTATTTGTPRPYVLTQQLEARVEAVEAELRRRTTELATTIGRVKDLEGEMWRGGVSLRQAVESGTGEWSE